jgi:hypothetical protein
MRFAGPPIGHIRFAWPISWAISTLVNPLTSKCDRSQMLAVWVTSRAHLITRLARLLS